MTIALITVITLLSGDRGTRLKIISRNIATPCGPLGRIVYGRIWRAASISRSEQPVKLISAVKRAENEEIGAGILDLRIFESIIGNTAGETDRPIDRPTGRSTDRQNLPRSTDLHSGLYHIPW